MSFQATQNAFMQHIRDPENNAFPDIEDRRLAIYRELFFNNIEGFVSSAFPVLKSLYEEQEWLALVRKFFVEHDCKSPYFLQISEEFLTFLSEQYTPSENDPVYMLELAHYEWVELALSIADKNPNEQSLADIKTDRLYFSSIAWRVSYQYSVQFASQDNPHLDAVEAGNHLVIYRDDEDDIQFAAINMVTAQLLQLIEANPGIHFETVLNSMLEMMPNIDPTAVTNGLITTIQDLSEKGIVVTK